MKEWPDNHPKAKLMAQKRAVILDAARAAFLSDGYDSVSMESIAASAGVSIMTLYRHAENKEDLFKAVIAGVCQFTDEVRQQRFAESLGQPLLEVLTEIGISFQNKLYSEQTLGLLRTVIAGASRFPELAADAYRVFIGEYEDNIVRYFALRQEMTAVSLDKRKQLSAEFIGFLTGTVAIKALLGINIITSSAREKLSLEAASHTLSKVDLQPSGIQVQ